MSRPRSDFGETRVSAPYRLKRRLWASIELDSYDSVKKALDDGADVNCTNEKGFTGLIDTLIERRKNWARIAGLLIHQGADVRGEYGNKKVSKKLAAQDLLIKIDEMDALEIVEQYAIGVSIA